MPDTNAALIASVRSALAQPLTEYADDATWNDYWVRFHLSSLADRLEAAERELAGINRALGTRAIFDGCATGEDKVDAMGREISRLERENEARHE